MFTKQSFGAIMYFNFDSFCTIFILQMLQTHNPYNLCGKIQWFNVCVLCFLDLNPKVKYILLLT